MKLGIVNDDRAALSTSICVESNHAALRMHNTFTASGKPNGHDFQSGGNRLCGNWENRPVGAAADRDDCNILSFVGSFPLRLKAFTTYVNLNLRVGLNDVLIRHDVGALIIDVYDESASPVTSTGHLHNPVLVSLD